MRFIPLDNQETSRQQQPTQNSELINSLQSLDGLGAGLAGSVAKGVGNVGRLAHQFLTQPQLQQHGNEVFGSRQSRYDNKQPVPGENIIKSIVDKIPTYNEGVEKVFGKENLKPGNFLTKNAYDLAEAAPMLAIFGAKNIPGNLLGSVASGAKSLLSPSNLGREYVATAGGNIAENLGFGQAGQIAASALSRYGFNNVARIRNKMSAVSKGDKIPSAGKTYGEEAIETMYNKTDKLGEKITTPEGRSLVPMVRDLKGNVEKMDLRAGDINLLTDTQKKAQRDMLKNLGKVEKTLNSDYVRPEELKQLKVDLFNTFKRGDSFIPQSVRDMFEQTYEKLTKVKPGQSPISSLSSLEDAVKKTELGKNFPYKEQKELLHNINLWKDKLSNPNLNARDLREVKMGINNTYIPGDTKFAQATKGALDSVKDRLTGLEKQHPEWGKYYNNAEEIFKLRNWDKSIVENFLSGEYGNQAVKSLTGLAKSSLGALLGGAAGSLAGLGKAGIALGALAQGSTGAAKRGYANTKFLQELFKTPEGQKIMWDMIGSGAKGVESGIAQSIHKFNNYAKKFEKKNSKKPRFNFQPVNK